MLKIILEKSLKKIIEKHVDVAVEKVEQIFGKGNGNEKKAMAIAYVMHFIKIPQVLNFLKPLLYFTIKKIISNAVEIAVDKLHSIQERLMVGI